jgi:hypothetical protein
MPMYVIEHHIDTLLELWKPFEARGITFSPWKIDWVSGRHGGWLARMEVEGESPERAFESFSRPFQEMTDKIAFVGQCYTTTALQPFTISKPEDDRFFFRHTKKRGAVPLSFGDKCLASLRALDSYSQTGDVFRYLHEAVNSVSFYTMLVMLVSALEAMSGVTDEKGQRKIDREYLAGQILGDKNLYDLLFKYGDGIRNQILHGGMVNDEMHGNTPYNQILFDKVIDYFNANHGLNIDKTIMGRPRQIIGNFHIWNGWCQWSAEELPIHELCERMDLDSSAVVRLIDRPAGF